MKKLFGTDGIRGIANMELTGHLAFEIGRAATYVIAEQTFHSPVILIGKDTRISGDLLEAAITAGICSMGGHAMCLGVIPTPGIAYLTQLYHADAGIVISASHNSFEFNGIKIFNSKGYKLSDRLEEKIEELVSNGTLDSVRPIGDKVGKKSDITVSGQDYASFLSGTVETDFSGMRLVMDCANGAAYKIGPELFKRLGASVDVIAGEPNGVNINYHCGATDLESLIKVVKGNGYDMGIAFDGDADRFMAVDEKGGVVDGDRVLAILILGFLAYFKVPWTVLLLALILSVNGILMTSMTGIIIDMHNPKLTWDSEQAAVKQNFNVMLNMLAALVAGGVVVVIPLVFRPSLVITAVYLFVVSTGINVLLNRYIQKYSTKLIMEME
jgi:phosphoglucosamine mutase